jgi:hypothetical protein
MKVAIWVIFLENHNSQVLFNVYFLSLIQVFSLNVFYNVLKKIQHIVLAKT